MSKASANILVVDDDPAIRDLIYRFLSQKKYQVRCAEEGRTALEIFDRFNPDLVILDLNLPDLNGYILCEEMQSRTDVLVIMLTSRTDTADKIQGFSRGADDYLTKPFDLQELEYRVGAILRRRRSPDLKAEKTPLVFDNLSIDPISREVKLNDRAIELTNLEFNLLYLLASSPGKAWQRDEIMDRLWESGDFRDKRVIDVHIGQVRRKIEPDTANPFWIKTVRGIGYKFEA